MKPGSSLPCLQEPSPGYSPEPDESSHVHTAASYFLKTGLNIILLSTSSIPQRCLHLVVVVGLVRLCDPESNAGGSLTTSRATHAGKVR
jgi:hypothetical protein